MSKPAGSFIHAFTASTQKVPTTPEMPTGISPPRVDARRQAAPP